jgi:hypothetical protein
MKAVFRKNVLTWGLGGLLCASLAHAQSSVLPPIPGTPTSTSKVPDLTPSAFVAAVEDLQLHPLTAGSAAMRPTLLLWFRQSPKVTVTTCVEEGALMGEDPLSNVLLSQILLEDASEQIRHPGISAQDSEVAGLLAMLRMYQGFRVQGVQASNAYVDDLQREVSQSGPEALIKHTCAGTASMTPAPTPSSR